MKFVIKPVLISFMLFYGCSTLKTSAPWGDNLEKKDNWWEVEEGNAQFWDPQNKILLVVGISDSDEEAELRDKRDESDDNARQKIAEFMSVEVNRFSQRLVNNGVKIKTNDLQMYVNQVVTGAVRIKGHYDDDEYRYYSLFKIKMHYFFSQVRSYIMKVAQHVATRKAIAEGWSKEQQDKFVKQKFDSINKSIDQESANLSKTAQQMPDDI